MIKHSRRPFGGRQIRWIIYDNRKVTEADEAIGEIQNLTMVRLKGDNLEQFFSDWKPGLMYQSGPPAETMLESLFRSHIRESN